MGNICISVSDMGKTLGISRASAYNLVHSDGFYPAVRVGGRVLIRVSALEKWVEEQTCAHATDQAV